MKKYIAKYYPIIDGREVEYRTTVEADNKTSAEALVRGAYIEMLEKYIYMINTFSLNIININGDNSNDINSLKENIAYAKRNMRIEII